MRVGMHMSDQTVLNKGSGAERPPIFLIAGIVLGLIAYFLPWYNHPVAGLTLIGIDMSEWLKFLPQYGAGQLPNRDYFYLPPLFIGGTLLFWGGSRHASFQWRRSLIPFLPLIIGSLVTLLAFPSIDEVFDPSKPPAEWRPRVIAITLILLLGWSTLIFPKQWRTLYAATMTLLLGICGLILPIYAAVVIRPIYGEWLKVVPAIGVGVWLYAVASLLILWQVGSGLFAETKRLRR